MPTFSSVTTIKLPDGRIVDEKFLEDIDADSVEHAKKQIEEQWDDAALVMLANALSIRYNEVFDSKKLKLDIKIS